MKNVLTIAGSDCSGGAGIQTDLKTFASCGVYGMSVITALTAQNTMGVNYVENVSQKMVVEQLNAIYDDIRVDAIKIGMLPSSEIIESVYKNIKKWGVEHIVVDPVMVSTSGHDLIDDKAKKTLQETLFDLAELITPNLSEAKCIYEMMTGNKIADINSVKEMECIGREIVKRFGCSVLVKGGHLDDEPCDVLIKKDMRVIRLDNQRIETKNTHGTGCTLSSAIASYLAKGFSLEEAVAVSKVFVTNAIKHSLDIGHGNGPTNPMGEIYDLLKLEFVSESNI